ncbi:MAG: AMP-dependent synthetase/ligase [Planctomycetota bacterium]|jgi:long-chain acyl-CoA synthetase
MPQERANDGRHGSAGDPPTGLPGTVPQILAHGVRSFADRVALRSCGSLPDRSYTYADVGRLASAAARQLVARGVGKGTPVGLLCENRPEWAITYFAIHLAGAVCVPIDTKLTSSECGAILERSGAPWLLASQALFDTASCAVDGLPGARVATIENLLTGAAAGGVSGVALEAAEEIAPDDVAVIAFTSGTTGTTKGVVLTHGNIASNAASGAGRMDGAGDDRLLSVLPLSHLFEQTGGLLVPFLWGASITYPGTLSPRSLADALRQSGATIALIVPAMARLFWKLVLASDRGTQAEPDALPGERLRARIRGVFGERFRYFISGGAALDADLARSFLDLGIPVLQGYGLSETAPLVSANTPGEHVVGSVGRPFPGVEVRIRPAGGRGQDVGEILVRGPNVMPGYFQDPRATEDAFEDGWLRTGDLGRTDENGFLYVLGRVKDVIVAASGMNVYPEEVEARIDRSAYVREVCVLGVRGPGAGEHDEQVAALVVPDDEAIGGEYTGEHEELLRRELRSACAGLAGYKRPRYFAVCLEPFPRTTTMKLKKNEIRSRLADTTLLRL